jgi:hypothetical protein
VRAHSRDLRFKCGSLKHLAKAVGRGSQGNAATDVEKYLHVTSSKQTMQNSASAKGAAW